MVAVCQLLKNSAQEMGDLQLNFRRREKLAVMTGVIDHH
jgi:hypothetical protein